MKRLYIIALFVFAGGFASAQENGNRDAQNRIVRGPYETNRFFDNVFVGVAGGVNLYFGENDSEGKFGKRLAPAMDIHVGKWFTPSIGARVGYAGLQAKGWTSAGTLYAKSADGGLFREKFGVMYLHADAHVELLERRERLQGEPYVEFRAFCRCRLGALLRQRRP